MALRLLLLLVVSSVFAGPRGRVGAPLGGGDALGGGLLPPDGEDGVAQESGAPSPAVCPSRCACVYNAGPKLVDCSNRHLTAFPPLEDVPEDVEYLDLSDNQIREVPRDLPAWDRLEVLNLAGNQLTGFPPRSNLASLEALEMLDLSRNNIASLRSLRPHVFVADNPMLQVLNLSGNGLQDLGSGSFQSLSSDSLQVLDVSHCSVSSINGEAALEGLPALNVLRAHDNPLQSLPVLHAPSLRELDVSGCQLRSVRAPVLKALPALTHLSVSRNPDLSVFQPPGQPSPRPDVLDQLALLINGSQPWSTSLQVLEADDCSLHDVSFLTTLPNLTTVHLRGNRIAALEPLGLLDNGVLQHLVLADNKLENLPADAFKGTELLKELDLSGNRLIAIHPDAFAQHGVLRTLNVSRNPIASLQLRAQDLRRLDASHCEVKLLVDGFLDGTPKIRHLNLSGNPLPALPARLVTAGVESALHTLDLSLCRLSDLSTTVLDGLPVLQTLNLRGNRFTDPLDVDAFNENLALLHIELDDNPWRCDCRTKDYKDFANFLLEQPAKEDVHTLRCHSPEAVEGQTWFDACLGPRTGSLASMDTWVFVVILTLAVASVAIGVLIVRRMTRDKARRRRQQQQQEEEERQACEQEAARRRLHRRLQQQQQEQLRRQSIRASMVSTEDPDTQPHPPSYEEAMLMDRMTQEDSPGSGDSDSEDESFTAELHKKISRMNSTGRVTDVIEEEEEGEGGSRGETQSAPTPSGSGAVRSNGNAPKLNTRL